MTAEELAEQLSEFLADAPGMMVLEDGEPFFDFPGARYSITADRGRCLLHLWSEERNAVRRVLEAKLRGDALLLSVQRFGQSKPSTLEICRAHDRRSPAAGRAARAAYRQLLRRVLERHFPDLRVAQLVSSTDLEHSFSSVYVRGLLARGNAASAVLGVNAQESPAAIDRALTVALLWLDYCRRRETRRLVGGLKLFLPAGASSLVRERMAHLDRTAADYQLYELEERSQELLPVDTYDRGNVQTRLARAADRPAALERFAAAVAQVSALAPEMEVAVLSPAEVAFRFRGLEFAHARLQPERGSFRSAPLVVFGLGAEETPLDEITSARLQRLVQLLRARRTSNPSGQHALWRAAPERWLESLVSRRPTVVDAGLDPECIYSQVPAFAAGDRAMIDLLGVTRDGRLAVIELKAAEDLHLPLQALDYWARVVWHHQRGEFQRFGYFPGRELSPEPPLLYLVAPALHIHPATDAILRYVGADVPIELVALDERWRKELKVVFRKRRGEQASKTGGSMA